MPTTLEARSRGCLDSAYVVTVDQRPAGEFQGRWFSTVIEVSLVGRRSLVFERRGFMRSSFALCEGERVLGRAERGGLLRRGWHLNLSYGPATMVSAKLFDSGFVVRVAGGELARVDRIGSCTNGWSVRAGVDLRVSDLLLIGLAYHMILQRRDADAVMAAS